MKLNGKRPDKPNTSILVFPRENDGDIVFYVQAVLDMDEFDKNHPEPEPPTVVKAKSGERYKDTQDKAYLQKMTDHREVRFNYLVLKALETTPGLEWETIDTKDPTTWGNWRKELKDACLSDAEQGRVLMEVLNANSVSEDRLKEARDRFIRSQAVAKVESSSQKEEPTTTESGEPASV